MVSDRDTSSDDFTWNEDEQNPNSDENESYSSSVLEQQAYFFLADEADLEAPEAESKMCHFHGETRDSSHSSRISHNTHLPI